MGSDTNTDYSLIERAAYLDDESAWQELHTLYYRFIFYVLRDFHLSLADREDISQNILLALTKSLKQYSRDKGRFRPWLKTVIKNATLMYIKKRNTYSLKMNEFGSGLDQEYLLSSELEAKIEKDWERHIVDTALERVKKHFKGNAVEVFKLSLEGMPSKEITERFGMSTTTVYTLRKRVSVAMVQEVRRLIADLEF